MNIQLLRRHFPELREWPEERQAELLAQAHERAYSRERKFEHWRRNLISLVWVCAVSLFIALVAGPALGLSRPATGGIIMVVVLPLFIWWRHRQYVTQLRPEVEVLIREAKRKPAP